MTLRLHHPAATPPEEPALPGRPEKPLRLELLSLLCSRDDTHEKLAQLEAIIGRECAKAAAHTAALYVDRGDFE